MKEAFWFKHDYTAHADSKIESLLFDMGWEGYGLFWAIIEKLAQESSHKLPTQYERIAYALRTDSERIKRVIESYGLFTIEDGFFYSKRLNSHFADRSEKSEKAQKSAKNRWGKEKQTLEKPHTQATECERIANAEQTQSDGNAIREEEKREEEIREEIITPKGVSDFSKKSPPPISEDILENKNEGQIPTSGEDQTITLVLEFLKKEIGVADFREDKKSQRAQARNVRDLKQEIGDHELRRRLEALKSDRLKLQNCNSISYLYGELKSARIDPIPPTPIAGNAGANTQTIPKMHTPLVNPYLADIEIERDPEESARVKAKLEAQVEKLKARGILSHRPNILTPHA